MHRCLKRLLILFALLGVAQFTAQASPQCTQEPGAIVIVKPPSSGQRIRLDCGWQVIRGKIVHPTEFDAVYRGETVVFPDRWRGGANNLHWDGEAPEAFGAATYRTKLHLMDADAPVGLFVQTPYSAMQVWIDGDLVVSNGVVSETGEEASAFYLRRLVQLAPKSTSEIVLVVSNWEHAVGGILRPPLLGDYEEIRSELSGFTLGFIFVFGALLSLLIFHFAYFFRSLTGGIDWPHIWYCGLLVTLMFRIANFFHVLYTLIPDLPEVSMKLIEYTTLFAAPGFYVAFLASMFPKEFPKHVWWLAGIVFGGLILVALVCPPHIYTRLNDPFIVFAISFLLYCQVRVFVAWKRKRLGAGSVVLFTVLFLMAGIYDAVHYLHIFDIRREVFSDMLPFAIVLLSTGFAIALSSRSRAIYDKATILASELQELNRSLDQRVKDRTKEAMEAKADAENSAREKTNFLAAASHDLRQPIHALGLFNLSLKNSPEDTSIVSRIAGMQSKLISSLSEMLDSMLDASRLEAQTVTLSPGHLSVSKMLSNLEVALRPLAEQANVTLKVMDSGEYVWADAKALRRMLTNLAINAINAAPGGRVTIGTRPKGRQIEFCVLDTGCGIPAADQEKIFKRFTRLDTNQNQKVSGLGLGLSIVAEFCQLMNTQLVLQSEEGKGTHFSFSLPRGERPAVQAQDAPVVHRPANGISLNILVVDDNPQALAAMIHLVESWGHRAAGAPSLTGALKAIPAIDGLNLILTDFGLEDGTTGLDVIAAVREYVGSEVPSVVVTGATSPYDLRILRDSGLPVFHKPLNPEELFDFIQTLQTDSDAATTSRR